MSARLILQLDGTASEVPAGAAALLRQAGVTDLRASHKELPGLYVATLPDTANVDDLLTRLRQQAGVRHVEVERFRTTI